MSTKYFAGSNIEEWICKPHKYVLSSSIVWKEIVDCFPMIGKWLAWKIGCGRNIQIGEDPWVGSRGAHKFLEDLISIFITWVYSH